jgi:transforming growth factor-beta-induced protein
MSQQPLVLHPGRLYAACMDILEFTEMTPNLTTLYTALEAAPMLLPELLNFTEDPTGMFTLFAPDDAAFDMLPQEPLMALLQNPEALDFILSLHVVPGIITAADLMDGDVLQTLNGLNLTVSVALDGTISLTAPGEGEIAVITAADLPLCNGIVHIIDAVLIPGSGDEPTEAPMMGGYGGEGPMGAYGGEEVVDIAFAFSPVTV